jgi:hypothetical protein
MDSKRVDEEIASLFDDIDSLLKNGDVVTVLTERGVNVSLAITAADGLRAYLKGEKARAAEDFSLVGEEITHRLAASAELAKTKPS